MSVASRCAFVFSIAVGISCADGAPDDHWFASVGTGQGDGDDEGDDDGEPGTDPTSSTSGDPDPGDADDGDPPPPADLGTPMPEPEPDPWDLPYCVAVADWDANWVAAEASLLDAVNVQRSQGGSCGGAGSFGPTGPLEQSQALTCAARNHSLDMGTRGFFSHTNPDGEGPAQRVDKTQYSWMRVGENIARGQDSVSSVMASWMSSSGHCAAIMNPDYTQIGLAVYGGGSGPYWTQVFGTPL